MSKEDMVKEAVEEAKAEAAKNAQEEAEKARLPLLRTKPPCGIPLWFAFNSSSLMKCTVVS